MGEPARMRWASASSRLPETLAAADEIAGALRESLGEGPVDLVLVFFSAPHVAEAAALVQRLRERLSPGTIAGTSARGVVSIEHEIEAGAALSAVAARLPGVELKPFVIVRESWENAFADEEEFERAAPGVKGAELVVMLADPFSLEVERVLGAFNRHAPGVRVVGGLASAGPRPGGNVVILNDWLTHEGGLGLAFHGAIRADVVVSQGCEPIGPPLDVTHVEENLILTLDGQPALERAEEVLRALPEGERERLRQGLYVGRPARGDASGRGDYLIRNLLGADRDRGAIAVADVLVPREKIRLHVRDAKAATNDLEMLLSPQVFDSAAAGVLLFACNGRGRMLFGDGDRDIATVQSALGGGVPATGMFCAGEIGPVGAKNFLHGHTASIAILRPR